MPPASTQQPSPGTLRLILTDAHFLLPFIVLLLGIALLCTLK